MKLWLNRLIRKLGPSWLVKDEVIVPTADGSQTVETDNRVIFAVTMVLDALAQRARDGILARFPGNGTMPADALRYAGRDRLIRRGPAETQEQYELRLVGAIDRHRTRGNAWRMLEQIREYCTPHDVRVRLWTEHGKVYTIDRDGSQSVVRTSDWDWDGSDLDEAWARFWVLIYVTTGSPTQPFRRLYWGDTDLTWGSGYTWGSTATPADVQAIRAIVDEWKPEGRQCKYIMVVFDDTEFDPTDTAPPLPDGTWGPWSKNSAGTQVATRSDAAIYWPGTRGPVVS